MDVTNEFGRVVTLEGTPMICGEATPGGGFRTHGGSQWLCSTCAETALIAGTARRATAVESYEARTWEQLPPKPRTLWERWLSW